MVDATSFLTQKVFILTQRRRERRVHTEDFIHTEITEPTEQRMPSSMLEWLSRDGGRQSQITEN